VAKEPGHRGEHGISVKTIAQGMPVDAALPVVTTLMCFFNLHVRLRVHRAPGIPCALFSGVVRAKPRARHAAGMRAHVWLNRKLPRVQIYPRHPEEREARLGRRRPGFAVGPLILRGSPSGASAPLHSHLRMTGRPASDR